MSTNIRSGASDGALQINGVDVITFTTAGITGGLINASGAEVAARTNTTKAVTPAGLQSLLVLGTVQNTTSGTTADFTGIPSWTKRITVMFSGFSTNGSSVPQVQLGAGSIDNTGYIGESILNSSTNGTATPLTTGFPINATGSAAYSYKGTLVLTLLTGNSWVASGVIATGGGQIANCAGTKTLSGSLDRVRLTTVNGTDTFDAGSVNILYE